MPRKLRVLSLGAGVQSSAILLMAAKGEVEPIDAAIFADTQSEPKAVYRWLHTLKRLAAEAGIPIIETTKGSLRQAALKPPTGVTLPAFVASTNQTTGEVTKGMVGRNCTRDYKISPVRRVIRGLMADRGEGNAELVMGISLDEFERMADSRVGYLTNVFPLVMDRITRGDCISWLARWGIPEPPKSACTFCPLAKNTRWARMRREDPDSWQDAVDFDRSLRHARPKLRGPLYLHPSLVPLEEADLKDKEANGQGLMFDSEMTDGCGVLCAADVT